MNEWEHPDAAKIAAAVELAGRGEAYSYPFAVEGIDEQCGLAQDGDFVDNYADAVAWARDICAGNAATPGGALIAMSAAVWVDLDDGDDEDSEERVLLYSCSPPGSPVWDPLGDPDPSILVPA